MGINTSTGREIIVFEWYFVLFGKDVGGEKSVPLLAHCLQKKLVLEGKTLEDETNDIRRQTIHVTSFCLISCSGHLKWRLQNYEKKIGTCDFIAWVRTKNNELTTKLMTTVCLPGFNQDSCFNRRQHRPNHREFIVSTCVPIVITFIFVADTSNITNMFWTLDPRMKSWYAVWIA